MPEVLNERALTVINRVSKKLTGLPLSLPHLYPLSLKKETKRINRKRFLKRDPRCAGASTAPHRPGYLPREPLPVLGWMVSHLLSNPFPTSSLSPSLSPPPSSLFAPPSLPLPSPSFPPLLPPSSSLPSCTPFLPSHLGVHFGNQFCGSGCFYFILT